MHNGRPLTALVLVLSLLLVLPGCFADPIPQDQVDFFRALSSTQYRTTTAVNLVISDVNGKEVTLLDKVQPGKEALLNFRDVSITVGTADRPVKAHIAVGVSDGSPPEVTIGIDVTSANMVALQEALKKMQTPKVAPKVAPKDTSPSAPTPPPTRDLTASVTFTGTQFLITNEDSFGWNNVLMKVNSGFIANGFWLKTARMEAGSTYTVGALQFAKDDGTRLDPFAIKPTSFSIQADIPGGTGFWNGGWD